MKPWFLERDSRNMINSQAGSKQAGFGVRFVITYHPKLINNSANYEKARTLIAPGWIC